MGAALALFRRDGRIPPMTLERAVDAMNHRAWTQPGSVDRYARVWAAPNLVLARWERVRDAEAADAIPDHPSGCVVVGDLRLDGRAELDRRLELPTHVTDHDRVLAAYLRWGEQLVDEIHGDFAFALWDPRVERLFCARDAFGVKPFYFVNGDPGFGFATEIRALLAAGWATQEIDPARVADFLAMVYEDKTRTFFRDVQRLPAGSAAWVSESGVRSWRYWRPDPTRELDPASDSDYVEQFLELFDRAVEDRLVEESTGGSTRIGSTLSGGLDSSSIAVTAAQSLPGLPTFSAVFPSLPPDELRRIDERPFMESVARFASLESHDVECDQYGPLGSLQELLDHEGQPFFGPNLYLHWELYRAAQAEGVEALLDGIDGDSTISHGLEYLSDLFRQGRWISLWRQAAQLSRTRPSDRLTAGKIAWRLGVLPNLPQTVVNGWRSLRGYAKEDWLATSRIHPDFAQSMGLLERRGRFDGQQELIYGSSRQRHAAVLDSAVLTDVFELADGAAAAFGVEPRYPFMDRRLAEFCLALPVQQKLKDGWTRSILRRAMKGRLPEDVRWRFLKTNLSPNFLRQIRDRDQAIVQRVFDDPPELLESYVDLPALRAEAERWVASEGREGDAYCLHRMTVFGEWLRRLEREPTTI